MPVTIINPNPLDPPLDAGAAIVETRANWTDQWQASPELVPTLVEKHAGHASDRAMFVREYGDTKREWESQFRTDVGAPTTLPLDLNGYWVRVRFITGAYDQWYGIPRTCFLGRIVRDSRQIRETGDPTGQQVRPISGKQVWSALGGGEYLRRITMGSAHWFDNNQATEVETKWVPSMNARDERRVLKGNRSALQFPGPTGLQSHLFGADELGGVELWSHLDFLRYLQARVITFTDQPAWHLAGELQALDDMKTHLRFGSQQRITQILAQLIPVERGMHYTIEPYEADGADDGFQIRAFALTSRTYTFGSKTLPRNPNTVRIAAPLSWEDHRLQISTDAEQVYDEIVVYGRRIVVCASLVASPVVGTLVPKWSAAQEQAYKDGTGVPTDSAARHDHARRRDELRDVYRLYGAPRDISWFDMEAAPNLDNEGTLISTQTGAYQTMVRRTLPWLPMLEGYDYTQNPPVDNNHADAIPDLVPTTAWARIFYSIGFGAFIDRYVAVDEAGISVNAPQREWGVWLGASPAHGLALNHFDNAAPTAELLRIDYETIIATIAFEADERLELRYSEVQNPRSRIEIEAPDAEYWFIAPNTFVGVDSQGAMVQSPSSPIVTRDDADEMHQIMAGAIARYLPARKRVEWQINAIYPWWDLIGHVLEVVEEDGAVTEIDAPITDITWEWSVSQVRTTIHSGFAGAV